MKTPICDFVQAYAKKKNIRLHMPGHKGKTFLGPESFDITEVKGADSLYEADGIIAESEKNASLLFGCKTFYSAEGSSLCIKAMLYLANLHANEKREKMRLLAGRNAHKTFVNCAALLGFDVDWLFPSDNDSYLSVNISGETVETALKTAKTPYTAVYITSPDYLGNTANIKSIAEVCHKYGALLIVDNAHGAYLNYLENNMHPIFLGADICCDSAHKTLPVLTGGAYLHISENAPGSFTENAKNALALFGSTSPSYLILQSLDKANAYLENDYSYLLSSFVKKLGSLKKRLAEKGYSIIDDEPLKITIETKKYGYTGECFADLLREHEIESEFSDPDYTVLMFTPEITDGELEKIEHALLGIEKKEAIPEKPPKISLPKKAMDIRDATLSPCEFVKIENSLGRIAAFANVGCPPAVPIVVSGEVIDEKAIECFKYYGITACCVVK